VSSTSSAKGAGQRRSRQREVILEELRKLKTHPRSDELYALVRRRLPRVSLGTVYRNLDRLQREGAAIEIYCGDFVRYDGDVSAHDHFMCRACRRVWDFAPGGARPEVIARRSQGQAGFRIENEYMMYSGLCPDCAPGVA